MTLPCEQVKGFFLRAKRAHSLTLQCVPWHFCKQNRHTPPPTDTSKIKPAPTNPESKHKLLSRVYPSTTPTRISIPAAIWTCRMTGMGCFLSSNVGRFALFQPLIPPVSNSTGEVRADLIRISACWDVRDPA